jgi:drug/metabolite transporter (DMT)-like permease
LRVLSATLLNSWGLGHVDTAFGALGLQGQQVATLFLVAWLLAEPIRPLGLLGGALIVAGIVAVAFSPRRQRVPKVSKHGLAVGEHGALRECLAG